MKRIEKYRYVLRGKEENVMGVVIGRMDGQVEKIFLGNNLTRSTKNYANLAKMQSLRE